MKLVEHFWTTVTVVVNWFMLSPCDVPDGPQFAITPNIDIIYTAENIRIQNVYKIDPALEYEIFLMDTARYSSLQPVDPKVFQALTSSADTQVWARTGFLVGPLPIANVG